MRDSKPCSTTSWDRPVTLLRTTAILFTTHLQRLLRSRRALVCLVISLLPVAAALFIRYLSSYVGPPPAIELGWLLLVQFVVPIEALILGSAVIAEEVEDRTITYLFSRPVHRMSVLLGRWLASLVVLITLLLFATWATVAILGSSAAADPEQALPEGAVIGLIEVVLLGAAVYSALFASCGVILKRPIIVGIGYTFAVEAFLSNLPGRNQALTIQYYLRSHLCGRSDAILERMRHLGATADLLPPDDALRTLAWVLVAALTFGCWAVSRRQYVLAA